MKNRFFNTVVLFLILSFTSCNQSPKEMLIHLPGYWEIESVITEEGAIKEFKISTTIDYIQINGTKGLRTKVNPQLDGSFINNGTTENFNAEILNDKLLLNYDNNIAIWTETVLHATKDKMVVKNEDGKEFTYKRFEEFDFQID